MSNDMPNDPLNVLKNFAAPAPQAEAKQRALAAGMAAFEAAQKKSAEAPKGNAWGQRLTSIITSIKGKTIMDMRLPIGTAAFALLVLPLGYQLYSTTAMTRLPPPALSESPVPQPAEAPAKPEVAAVEPQLNIAPQQAPREEAAISSGTLAQAPLAPEPMDKEIAAAADSAVMMESMPAPPPAPVPSTVGRQSAGAMQAPAASFAPESDIMVAPVELSGDEFTSFAEQRLKIAAEEPVSTFSIDVDTASYSYVRRMLEDGYLPEPDAVRIEEMINYFPYDYPAAESAAVPFKPTIAVYPTPWNPKTQLLQIGIKGYVPPAGEDKPANLV
ncbi:MAG TPA: von Willebrand factor type A domain-containing protein, partial [Devosia sp.]